MVNSNLDADKSIIKDSIEYDPNKLAELARRAIGTRSVAEFCAETDLSKSFVSRLLNAKLPNAPTRRTLYRFAGKYAKPQNGITLGDMLNASGYEAAIEDFSFTDASLNNEKLSLSEEIRLNYSQAPAFALYLMLNVLIAKGIGQTYSINFELGVFSLKIKPLDNRYTTIIGIPAFCNDDSAIMPIQVAVLTNLISSVNNHTVNESLFYVMTDNSKMYNLLFESLPVLQNMKLAVLLTNKSFNGFSQQDTITLNKADNEFTEFPLILND